jgi:cellular nucleic acid-binding protein
MLYVLLLDSGNYYVGKSLKRNPYDRINQHFEGKGAAWTIEHKPVRVIKMTEGVSENEENDLTLQCMREYGWRNVRGGKWVKKVMDRAPECLYISGAPNDATFVNCYRCGEVGHLAAKCVDITKWKCTICNNMGHVSVHCPSANEEGNMCFACNNHGHFASQCPESKCFNCGDTGHVKKNCVNSTRCFVCSKAGHDSKQCVEKIRCFQCGGNGHTAYSCQEKKRCFRCGNTDHVVDNCTHDVSV